VDKRILGLRNSYRVVFSADRQRQLTEEEAGRRLFGPVVSGGLSRSELLRNGGQLHLDVPSRPEYETPECDSALDLVVHDKAGERILEGLLADAGQRRSRVRLADGRQHDLPLSAPEVARADLAYHDIDRGHGLYYQAQRSGAVERTARELDIFAAKTVKPGPVRYRQAG
jgi:hypothetical protein